MMKARDLHKITSDQTIEACVWNRLVEERKFGTIRIMADAERGALRIKTLVIKRNQFSITPVIHRTVCDFLKKRGIQVVERK